MRITTTICLPPKVTYYFDKMMLSHPCGFRDTSKLLDRIYTHVRNKLLPRASNSQIRQQKCNQLEQEFLEIYGRIQAKEEELKTKTEHHTKEPFYRFKSVDRESENIFARLRV